MIFQRSLIREFSLVAMAVVGVLLAIILTRLLILLLGKAATGDVLPEAVFGLIAFGILNYLPVLLGIAVFAAVLLTLSRSYRDSEMTVWFTSGLSLAAWVTPVLQFCLPVALVCALLSFAVSPWSQAQSVEYQRLLLSRDEVAGVTPGVFRESRNSERVFFVDKLSADDAEVNNVFVQSTERDRMGVMVAERGFLETAENGDRFVVLLKGRRYEGTPGTLDYRTVDFDRYAIRIEAKEAKREAPTNKQKSTLDLFDDPTPPHAAELHWRFATPLAVVIMGLFAIPLAFVNPRSGRSWNLLLAVLVYALYSNLLSIFQAWTAQGKIPVWLGLWPVHGAMVLILLILFSRQLFSFHKLILGR
ncbi:LPS export ABC transporter permease LptF [Usitatibacter palustris]|uniref:Lipopolysaccharide export system permease protein LptF n=1 Tax=Usitatibacter palustris TaxID=2732487 RepID=A0A6M4H5M1_9PROT|nr:LPS export ABC transporter permease LptF [Usitatibacter palustris]QJR14592.1 Lipopolysaccharide export system permease protein LptF [Usitatibacter palustris]